MNRHATLLCVMTSALHAAAAQPLWSPQFSDARNAAHTWDVSYTNCSAQPGKFRAVLPTGEWQAITCTMWCRFNGPPGVKTYRTSGAVWCPEPIQRSGPDITAGAFGYPHGTNIDTSASIEYTFGPYPGERPAAVFPRGAYTVAGWSSNAVTVTLGGADITLGPGDFNRNALPGVSDGIILTGSGPSAVGVSLLRPHQFFNSIDGVVSGELLLFADESTVTNELVFLAFRLRLDASNHIYRADMWNADWSSNIGQTVTNALPDDPAVRSLSSRGLYYFGLDGIATLNGSWTADIFDGRINTRWMSDADLERVYLNGREEADRRQIPRWK